MCKLISKSEKWKRMHVCDISKLSVNLDMWLEIRLKPTQTNTHIHPDILYNAESRQI